MAVSIDKLKSIILPKKRGSDKATAYSNTFNPSATTTALAVPAYRNHTQDIFTQRTSQDSRALMKDLFKYDSDVSAAVHSYLTVANTTPQFTVYNSEGVLDLEGQTVLNSLLEAMFTRNDYSTGFSFTSSLRQVAEDCRYMLLLRGAIAVEVVMNKLLIPSNILHVDASTLEWFEAAPGVYKPQQRPANSNQPISLDIPQFFVKFYRQNPTEIYPESIFVSSINTIAARQQVINDLYRIMQQTGYPRIEITVLEEVIRKSAPASVKQNDELMNQWVNARLSEVQARVQNMRADSVFVHTDSYESKVMNDKGPSSALDATNVIQVLNSANQAALKTMATIIGRGESGVNTASVEARIFSLSADAINGPIADLFSDMFTFLIRVLGYEGRVKCEFEKVELRPETELEANLTMRQARMLENLSLGLITDDEYHLIMFNRPRPSDAPELSGTGFMSKTSSVDAEGISPNSDPLGRSVASKDKGVARSDAIKKSK